MKILGIVILYYPDADIARNIKSYIGATDRLILWDNTPQSAPDTNTRLIINRIDPAKIIFMGDGCNHAIAYALNQAVDYALRNGYTHLLTMDQDSRFEKDSIQRLIQAAQDGREDPSKAIFASNTNGALPVRSGLTRVNDAITSGSIFRIDAAAAIGPFNERYAIDAVDYEFCYRLATAGYSTYIVGDAVLSQIYGNPLKSRLGFYTSNYSAIRTYHIIRNQIDTWKRYPDYFAAHKRELLFDHILYRIPKIILTEKNKLKKLSAVIQGITDGLLGRFPVKLQ